MLNEKKNEVTEEVKEARELTEEELERVNGGVAPHDAFSLPGIVSPASTPWGPTPSALRAT